MVKHIKPERPDSCVPLLFHRTGADTVWTAAPMSDQMVERIPNGFGVSPGAVPCKKIIQIQQLPQLFDNCMAKTVGGRHILQLVYVGIGKRKSQGFLRFFKDLNFSPCKE